MKLVDGVTEKLFLYQIDLIQYLISIRLIHKIRQNTFLRVVLKRLQYRKINMLRGKVINRQLAGIKYSIAVRFKILKILQPYIINRFIGIKLENIVLFF